VEGLELWWWEQKGYQILVGHPRQGLLHPLRANAERRWLLARLNLALHQSPPLNRRVRLWLE